MVIIFNLRLFIAKDMCTCVVSCSGPVVYEQSQCPSAK